MRIDGKIFMGILLMTLWVCVPVAASNNGFKLVKKDEAIALYERWISAGSNNQVREIQAVFYARSDAASVIRLLKDPAQGKNWNSNVSMYTVQVENAGLWTTYIRYDIPWPMDDQDCCLTYHVKPVTADHKTVAVMFESKTGSGCPVYKGVTRIAGTRGKWLIEQTDPGALKITYTITSDKNKTMPRWISDPIVHKNVFQTLAAFKKTLENEKP